MEQVLSEDCYLDRKNEIPEGKQPYYKLPVFNLHKVGLLPCVAEHPLASDGLEGAAGCPLACTAGYKAAASALHLDMWLSIHYALIDHTGSSQDGLSDTLYAAVCKSELPSMWRRIYGCLRLHTTLFVCTRICQHASHVQKC